jgi:uncharacterized membrane protein YhaH (DUF805 family)
MSGTLRRLERAFLVSVFLCWRRAPDFVGRSGRQAVGAYAAFAVLGATYAEAVGPALLDASGGAGVFLLLAAPPGIAALWRRMHDTGRSGWGMVAALLPFGTIVLGPSLSGVPFAEMPALVVGFAPFLALVGFTSLVVWLAAPGEPAANRYGPPPRHGT